MTTPEKDSRVELLEGADATTGSGVAKGLREWSAKFHLEGDLCRCRECKRAIHVSRTEEPLSHQDGCKRYLEIFPWRALRYLLSQNTKPSQPEGKTS